MTFFERTTFRLERFCAVFFFWPLVLLAVQEFHLIFTWRVDDPNCLNERVKYCAVVDWPKNNENARALSCFINHSSHVTRLVSAPGAGERQVAEPVEKKMPRIIHGLPWRPHPSASPLGEWPMNIHVSSVGSIDF